MQAREYTFGLLHTELAMHPHQCLDAVHDLACHAINCLKLPGTTTLQSFPQGPAVEQAPEFTSKFLLLAVAKNGLEDARPVVLQ